MFAFPEEIALIKKKKTFINNSQLQLTFESVPLIEVYQN